MWIALLHGIKELVNMTCA